MLRPTALRHFVTALLVLSFALVLAVPLASAQGDDGARTVTDFMGRPVTLEAPPQRVVGMSASVSEMLFAIGIMPVGVTAGMDYPAAAQDLPTFGSGYQPDLEALAALEPDLIIANAQLNMAFMDQLDAIAPTLMVMTLTAADVPANIRLIGEATWHDTSADYVAMAYEDMLAMAGTIGMEKEGPSILIVVGTLDVPNYGKSSTYLGDMATLLGASNVADSEPDAGPYPGYASLSIEAILDADPDMIFTITRGADVPMSETMLGDPVWAALSAVENGQVYELDNRLFLESPGPRFADGLIQLYDIFYGEGMAG